MILYMEQTPLALLVEGLIKVKENLICIEVQVDGDTLSLQPKAYVVVNSSGWSYMVLEHLSILSSEHSISVYNK